MVSRDGKHIGDVEQVFTDNTEEHRITHFSISEGRLFKKELLLPASWVDLAREHEIHLVVSAHLLEGLDKAA